MTSEHSLNGNVMVKAPDHLDVPFTGRDTSLTALTVVSSRPLTFNHSPLNSILQKALHRNVATLLHRDHASTQ